MGYSDESSNKWSFFSFVLGVIGFFIMSFYYGGVILGVSAIILSFLAEDRLKEKSIWQYLAVIIAVIDIIGAIAGWTVVFR